MPWIQPENVLPQTTFTGQIRAEDGSLTAPSYSFTNTPGMGWFRGGAGVLSAVAGSGFFITTRTDAPQVVPDTTVGLHILGQDMAVGGNALAQLILEHGSAKIEFIHGNTASSSIDWTTNAGVARAYIEHDPPGHATANRFRFGLNGADTFYIDRTLGELRIVMANPLLGVSDGTPLTLNQEVTRMGSSASLSRARLRGFYTSSPANPPADETDCILVDPGASPVMRFRYNDASVMKVGDVALI